MIDHDQADLDVLAAEYALGSLDDQEHRVARNLLRQNPDFARLVRAWQMRLGELSDAIEPVEPPPELWNKIKGELGPPRQKVLTSPERRRRTPSSTPLLESLAFWRWSTMIASGAAAAMALLLTVGPTSKPAIAPPSQRYVAVLNGPDSQPALVVSIDLVSSRMSIRPVDTGTTTGNSLQLWLIANEETPRPLGLLEPSARTSIDLTPAVDGDVRQGLLAVSLEPPGGSPTGLPTGPVLYKGPVLPLDG